MNVILFEPTEMTPDGQVRVTGARASHLKKVLGVMPGRDVRVGIVDGCAGLGTVTGVDPEAVTLKCAFAVEPPPVPAIDVLLAVPRPKVLRRLWPQLAALGVRRIMLSNAERVERHYFDTHMLDVQAYRPLLIEGLQQARDTRLPQVTVHRRFKVLVEDDLDGMCGEGLRLVAHPGVATSPATAMQEHRGGRVLVAIGPEGGWNTFELNLLASRGFSPIGLGSRSLRTDTASIAILAVLHDALRRSAGQAES